MENQEFKRYDRQIILEEIGFKGQQRLKSTSVLVVGAGGLGCPLLLYLSAAGVGKIGIIDHDVVDESNLQRQVIFNTSDLGKHKAEVAASKLSLLNPHVNLQAYPIKIDSENAEELCSLYDLVIDGSDNFPTRYLVNDTCLRLKKPLIFGSIYQFEGQVSVFNYRGGPDYRSCYPEPPLPENVPNCAEGGIIGSLAGIIGSIMANETIKVICDFGEVLSGKLLIFNAINNDMQIFNIQPEGEASSGLQEQHSKETDPVPKKQRSEIYKITLAELKEWEDQGEDFYLIDLREAYEFEEKNAGGTNIPLYEIKERMHEIPTERKLVLSCNSGVRSRIAAKLIDGYMTTEIFIIS